MRRLTEKGGTGIATSKATVLQELFLAFPYQSIHLAGRNTGRIALTSFAYCVPSYRVGYESSSTYQSSHADCHDHTLRLRSSAGTALCSGLLLFPIGPDYLVVEPIRSRCSLTRGCWSYPLENFNRLGYLFRVPNKTGCVWSM